jgi:hypothetical protein
LSHEKNISTEQIETRQEARFSEADVHKSGATDRQPAQSKGTEKTLGLAELPPVQPKPKKGKEQPEQKNKRQESGMRLGLASGWKKPPFRKLTEF